MVVRFDISGLDEAYRFTRQLPKRIDQATVRTNEKFMKSLRRTAKFKCPKNSGEARRSIKIDRTKTKGKQKQFKLIADKNYVYWIIHGRRPGKMPPVSEIMKWNKLSPRTFQSALNLAKHIGQHGTKPNDFINRAIEHTMVKFDMMLEEEFNRTI